MCSLHQKAWEEKSKQIIIFYQLLFCQASIFAKMSENYFLYVIAFMISRIFWQYVIINGERYKIKLRLLPLTHFQKGEKHFDTLFNHIQYKNMLGGRTERYINYLKIHRVFLVHFT